MEVVLQVRQATGLGAPHSSHCLDTEVDLGFGMVSSGNPEKRSYMILVVLVDATTTSAARSSPSLHVSVTLKISPPLSPSSFSSLICHFQNIY